MMAATRRVLRGIAFDMDGTLTGQISVTYDFIGMPACSPFLSARSEIQRSIRRTAGATTGCCTHLCQSILEEDLVTVHVVDAM